MYFKPSDWIIEISSPDGLLKVTALLVSKHETQMGTADPIRRTNDIQIYLQSNL